MARQYRWTKALRKEWKTFREAMHEHLIEMGAERTVEPRDLSDGEPHLGGVYRLPTPFGPVEVTLYASKDVSRAAWMPCRLLLFGKRTGPGRGHRCGFDHWKQNWHNFGDLTPEHAIRDAQRHLQRFFRDTGRPTPEELARLQAKEDERSARWAAEFERMNAERAAATA